MACARPDARSAVDSPTIDGRLARSGSLLVATDGSRTAGAALRVTAQLLRDQPARLTVLAILEPRGAFLTDALLDGGRLRRDGLDARNVLDKVRRQIAAIGLTDSALRVEFGAAGPTIAAAAEDIGASMVIIGLGGHRWLARFFGTETITALLDHTDRPVLAVARDARTLPRTAMCAIDFGESGASAALAAVRVLEPGGTIHLVHVASPVTANASEEGWHRVYEAGVEGGFRQLRLRLHRPDVTVVSHLMRGDIGPTLLEFARRHDVELIALGRHNRPPIAEFLLGSTATTLLRRAPCSILVAPALVEPLSQSLRQRSAADLRATTMEAIT
jgi:nucleotide-binding universal stress UspA family protein